MPVITVSFKFPQSEKVPQRGIPPAPSYGAGRGMKTSADMVNSDFLKKIRRIHITTSRIVTDVFAGQYHSAFKGRGMAFDEVREYQPGDDIRSIDWNVTARSGRPHIKKFIEEREMTVMIAQDVSSSVHFGTSAQLKSQFAAELGSIFAYSAIRNNDKVGFAAFSDKIESLLPPRKGSRYVLRIIRDALYYGSEWPKTHTRVPTDLGRALDYLNKVLKRRAVVFLISDFYDAFDAVTRRIDPAVKKKLITTNKHHDLIAVTLTDRREETWPSMDLTSFSDPETGRGFFIDAGDARVRKEFFHRTQECVERRRQLFASAGIDHIDIRTDEPYTRTLMRFFRKRERRLVR